MADPLLTSLCTICHIQTPKYKCPRCGTRTCSLACVKKHKKWSSCNGERDPTVYMPREKLKTDAGIDHDYNFLTKIERSVERVEKILKEEKDILPQDDTASRPPPSKRARLHKGQSRGRVTFEQNSRRWDKNSMQRMRQLGIRVASVPYGMTRAKENKTSWNKRTRTMNWQVEWLEWKSIGSAEESPDTDPRKFYIRYWMKFLSTLDSQRVWNIIASAILATRNVRRKKQRSLEDKKIITGGGQELATTAWSGGDYVMQDSKTAAWNNEISGSQIIEGLKDKYRFFYLKPRTPSREAQRLIPLRPTDNLATILPGLDIVEFPTIYVLPANSTAVPEGCVVESRLGKSRKRQGSGLVGYLSEEEGEAMDEQLDGQDDDTTSSSGSDSFDMSE
ncbi:Box C/D snoRNA protein 1 [Daldinia childiae]|uniref:Box C/D snoRNA protein 1 n=1 Tax=Daldinia childiae TaxID=326645 RepID=UPI001444D2CB|nr:Box C/D snoRNA protein 1 [Daldinia childiae]KAF3070879.1 Box C/D snoRNA protein 1 [Daldinia childiae]